MYNKLPFDLLWFAALPLKVFDFMFFSRLIPVPMVGFKELLRRLQIQEQMTKQHQTRVDVSKKTSVPDNLTSLTDMGTVPSDYQQRDL